VKVDTIYKYMNGITITHTVKVKDQKISLEIYFSDRYIDDGPSMSTKNPDRIQIHHMPYSMHVGYKMISVQ
jgi:hypothetical protein